MEIELVEEVAGVGELGDHLLLARAEAGAVIGDGEGLPAGGALGFIVEGTAAGVAAGSGPGCGRCGCEDEILGEALRSGEGAGEEKKAGRSGAQHVDLDFSVQTNISYLI